MSPCKQEVVGVGLDQEVGACHLHYGASQKTAAPELKLECTSPTLCMGSLDPRPSDLCILMEGLVRDDHVG